MIIHFIRIATISILLVICMFLPYIPGDYDGLSVTLSTMTQIFGMAGLLLVPIGIIWLVYETLKRRKRDWQLSNKGYAFALATMVALGLVPLITLLGAFVQGYRSFGIIALAVWTWFFSKLIIKLRHMRKAGYSGFNFTPLYLVCIPTIVVALRFLFIIPATEFSRNHVIRNSARLIEDIETYYKNNGHYPLSLHSLWEDYKPGITGIKRYCYEPSGDAYNLFFEQFSYQLGIREIVMYNKLDEQDFSSHNQDLLQLTAEDINLQRGHIGVYELPVPHWKYFWFD